MVQPALIFAAVLTLQAPAAEFDSPEGGFRVALPATPEQSAQQIPAAMGTISAHFFTTTSRGLEYVVSYSDYPHKVTQADPAKVLEGAANGALRSKPGAKLLRTQDRKIGGLPGKEVEFSYPGPDADQLGRTRLYLYGTRMYSLSIAGPPAEVAGASDAFFRSFVLKPASARTAPTPVAAAPTAPAGVRPFAPRGGGFTVNFPGTPQEQTSRHDSPIGEVEAHVYVAAKDGVNFVVTATRFPGDPAQALAGTTLDDLVRGSVSVAGGTLVARKPIRLGAIEGREFEFAAQGRGGAPLYGRSRVFIARGVVYQLVCSGPKARVSAPASDPFFLSFALTSP